MTAPQSNSVKILITAATIIVVSAVLIFFGLKPLLTKFGSVAENIRKNNSEIADLSSRIEILKQAEAKFSQVESKASDVTGLFPAREDSVTLVESLENAYKRAGLVANLSITDTEELDPTLSSLRPVKLIKGSIGLDEVPYTLNLTGDYRQLTNLFLYFENSPFLTEIRNLSLAGESVQAESGKTLTTGIVNAQIEGILFVKKTQ